MQVMTEEKSHEGKPTTCHRNPSWTSVLIIAHVPVLILTLVFNFLSSGGPDVAKGLYLSNTGNVSDKYWTKVTPAGWTFSIWGFIYAWQVIHTIYSLTLLCRKNKDGQPLYLQPGHIHFTFYIVYMFNNAFNIGWIFLFDREYVEVAFVFLCLITVTLYICGAIICRFLHQSGSYFSSTNNEKEIWLTRMLVLNGIAFYGTWCTLATLLNFSIVLQHKAYVDADICAWVFVAIVTVEIITWFVLETFVFDKYLRYCFSQYIVLLVAFAGILSNNYNPASPEPYLIYGFVLLAVAIVLFIVKVIVMFVRGKRSPILYYLNAV